VYQTMIVCEFKSGSQLDGAVIDQLDIGDGHVDGQVQLQGLDVLVHVSSVGALTQREKFPIMRDGVKTCHHVGMRRDVYPPLYVLVIGQSLKQQIILEVLTIDYEAALCEDFPHL
jgi:hypothetical protein